jgi:hypothetical protein
MMICDKCDPESIPTRRTMNRKHVVSAIKKTEGRIFTVKFIKRSTGEERVMKCRYGVARDLKGVGPAYSAEEHKLITVYDIEKEGYRAIPIESISYVKIDGVEHTVKG